MIQFYILGLTYYLFGNHSIVAGDSSYVLRNYGERTSYSKTGEVVEVLLGEGIFAIETEWDKFAVFDRRGRFIGSHSVGTRSPTYFFSDDGSFLGSGSLFHWNFRAFQNRKNLNSELNWQKEGRIYFVYGFDGKQHELPGYLKLGFPFYLHGYDVYSALPVNWKDTLNGHHLRSMWVVKTDWRTGAQTRRRVRVTKEAEQLILDGLCGDGLGALSSRRIGNTVYVGEGLDKPDSETNIPIF